MAEGDDLIIHCPIIGNPELRFVWYELRLDELSGNELERIIQPEDTSEKVSVYFNCHSEKYLSVI